MWAYFFLGNRDNGPVVSMEARWDREENGELQYDITLCKKETYKVDMERREAEE
jgi:hypothetical protein